MLRRQFFFEQVKPNCSLLIHNSCLQIRIGIHLINKYISFLNLNPPITFMNLARRMKRILTDPLASFKMLQIVIAAACIAIPVILRTFDKDTYYPAMAREEVRSGLTGNLSSVENRLPERKSTPLEPVGMVSGNCDTMRQVSTFEKICKDRLGFRTSLSDYAHSSNSYLFGMLYMMAALLYIYNGVVYLNRLQFLTIHKNGPLANILTGLSLIAVILHPDTGRAFPHLLFSVLFFVGNIYMMLFVGKADESKAFRTARRVMGVSTILVFIGWTKYIGLYSLLWAESISLLIISSYLIMMAAHVEETRKKKPLSFSS